jgi:TDG/mug DNA glycosylase family protein
MVALVGVTIYRALFPDVARGAPVPLGEAPAMLAGTRVFVLPNPSGRNANYAYAEMLEAFRRLGEAVSAGRSI